MGSGALFSIALGKKDEALLRSAVGHAFGLILAVTVVLNVLVYAFLDAILRFLQIPQELYGQMREYLVIIFTGLLATFLYNFFACLLRAAGNSVAPLCFLGLSAGLNIALDLLFVLRFGSFVVLPGINPAMLDKLQSQTQGGLMSLLDMFSGGAFSNASIFALGIMPYISTLMIQFA